MSLKYEPSKSINLETIPPAPNLEAESRHGTASKRGENSLMVLRYFVGTPWSTSNQRQTPNPQPFKIGVLRRARELQLRRSTERDVGRVRDHRGERVGQVLALPQCACLTIYVDMLGLSS